VSPKDAITDVGKVRRSRLVKEYGVFQLAGVSNDALVANEHAPTDIRIVADFTSVADVSRACDMCPRLDARVVTDIYGSGDRHGAFDSRFADSVTAAQEMLQIGAKANECFPYILGSIEQFCVIVASQLKKIVCFQTVGSYALTLVATQTASSIAPQLLALPRSARTFSALNLPSATAA
jgi:hypothetical protein